MSPSILERYFAPDIMSVHLREKMKPQVKRGKPGSWTLEILENEQPLDKATLEYIVQTLHEETAHRDDAFIEKERKYSTVMQIGDFRTVVIRTPLSNVLEITVIRPVVRLHLEEYKMNENLKKRLEEKAEGILIAGAPGNGKTTFAQALVELYYARNKIIKTIEVPRDLHVPEGVTQYALSHSSLDEIRDLLLLTRPDFTFFDEIRNPEDFFLFKDLRLTGIGMVGVIHAHRAIDAVQRMIGKIELGMITQVVDTVIFIQAGEIASVYDLEYSVRVPSGMQDADLARPVIIIKDFETGKEEYEIYTYGEEIVVMPLSEMAEGPAKSIPGLVELGVSEMKRQLRNKVSRNFELEVVNPGRVKIYLNQGDIPKFIGKGGANIQELERHFNVSIDVVEKSIHEGKSKAVSDGQLQDIPYEIEQDRKGRVVIVPLKPIVEAVLFIDSRRQFPIKVHASGVIKVEKGMLTSIVQRGNFRLLGR